MKQEIEVAHAEASNNLRSGQSKTPFDLTDSEFGDYLITGTADPDRLFHKFRALHVEQNLPAFIKILRPECVGTDDFTAQFKALIDRLKTVVHASIVPVIEGGVINGQHYLVEEQFDGFALGRGLESEHFDHEDKIKVVNQVGSALIALHNEGIIHGELNPSHVFITVDDISKLSGYGVPHFIQQSYLNPPTLRVEKRRFMAPEVLGGEVATKASDLYSLASLVGCIFTTESNWSKSDSRLSGLTLSPKLLACLQKGMSKNPKNRPESVEQFLDDLASVFSSPTSQASNVAPQQEKPVEHLNGAIASGEKSTVHHSNEKNPKLSIPAEQSSKGSDNPKKFSVPSIALISLFLIVVLAVGIGLVNFPKKEVAGAESTSGEAAPVNQPVPPAATPQPVEQVQEPSALAIDESWPGFLRIVSLPDSGVPWKVPAILVFDDESQATKEWVERIEATAKSKTLLSDFIKIRQTQNDSVSLAQRYNISDFPVLIVTDSNGELLARFTPASEPKEVETTLEFITKGLTQK